MSNPVSDRVVLVTGATRGVGRGSARGFARNGGTVAVTGRDEAALADVAAEIEQAGATAITLLCDHRDDAQAADAIARLLDRTGRIDILVNNAAQIDSAALLAPGGFWEKPLSLSQQIEVGLRSSYVAAWHAAPAMVAAGRGLIANISFYGAVSYFHGPGYGAAKAGTDKMSHDMAQDLAAHNVAVVSLWPGFVLTDMVKALPPEMIPDDLKAMLPGWETPEFSGLVIDALASDPNLMALSGKALIGAELGLRYGIADIDGKVPQSYRATMGAPTFDWVR